MLLSSSELLEPSELPLSLVPEELPLSLVPEELLLLELLLERLFLESLLERLRSCRFEYSCVRCFLSFSRNGVLPLATAAFGEYALRFRLRSFVVE